MEKSKVTEISIDQAFYLLKHFHGIKPTDRIKWFGIGKNAIEIQAQVNTVGSKFESSFCDSPFKIGEKIKLGKLIETIEQSNGRKAEVFEFTQITGEENIVPIFELSETEKLHIHAEKRGDFEAKVFTTERKFYTHKLTVISSASNELITCFPGGYAPAFVSDWMSDREKTLSKSFWDQHLFKKYI